MQITKERHWNPTFPVTSVHIGDEDTTCCYLSGEKQNGKPLAKLSLDLSHLLCRVAITGETGKWGNDSPRVMDMGKSHPQKEKAWHLVWDAGSWTDSWWSEDWLPATLESVWERRGQQEMHPFLGS